MAKRKVNKRRVNKHEIITKRYGFDIITIIFFLSLFVLILMIPVLIKQKPDDSILGKVHKFNEKNNECYYKFDNKQCVCLDLTNNRYKIYFSNNQQGCEFSCIEKYSCSSAQNGLSGWITNEDGRIVEVILS